MPHSDRHLRHASFSLKAAVQAQAETHTGSTALPRPPKTDGTRKRETARTRMKIGNEFEGEVLEYFVGANVVERLGLVDELAAQRTTVLGRQVLHQTTPTDFSHTTRYTVTQVSK